MKFKLIVLLLFAALVSCAFVAADDFYLRSIEGKTIKLSDFRGKTVFLHFWATWCPPCREELPYIQKFYKKQNVLMVSLDKNEADVKKFMKKNGFTFAVALDPDGKIARKYGVTGIPTTFVINDKGIIIDKTVGARDWNK